MQTETATKRIAATALEDALSDHASVEDCVVLVRPLPEDSDACVAYVVPARRFSAEALDDHLADRFPGARRPDAYVPVSALPLTPGGKIDRRALTALPVIDAERIRRCEEVVARMPGVAEVAVVAQDHHEEVPPLHLSDLLPDWQCTAAAAAVPAGETERATSAKESVSGTPAISDGGTLPEEPGRPSTLAEALRRAATEYPDHGVCYVQADGRESFQTYPALLGEAERILGGLRRIGLRPGDKALFQCDRNEDFIPAFWACALGGFVPVPLAVPPSFEQHNSTVGKLRHSWEMLGRPVVLTGSAIAPAPRSLADLFDAAHFRFADVEELRAADRDADWHPAHPDDVALILLTSGSTGAPKGVQQCHRSILS